MQIMQPKVGIVIAGASLLATGITSMALAAPSRRPPPACYSTCPPAVQLTTSSRVLLAGLEEIERFAVSVRSGVIGAGSVPTGTVTVETGTTVLCTITLVDGRGSCSPPPNALPAGFFKVVASYSGDGTYSPAQSRPTGIEVIGRGPRRLGSGNQA
jgi:hypothetical protein